MGRYFADASKYYDEEAVAKISRKIQGTMQKVENLRTKRKSSDGYVGNYVNDLPHGNGKLYDYDKKKKAIIREHCGVWENITPIEKQNSENRFWNLFNGGKIQYCRYPISYNKTAIKTLVDRAMELGFYEGINLSLAYCEECGYEELDMDVCTKCGSELVTKIDRMNGYLGYTRVHGKTRYNDAKNAEIRDRVSM